MNAASEPIRAPGKFDVAVVGGGPAGAAIAITLARSGAAVVLLERTGGEGNPVGESLPPSATPLLHRLGAWDAVAATRPLAIHANRSLWGAPNPDERDFLREPYGPGWRVDRPAFNAALLAKAERASALVLRHTQVRAVERDGPGWRIAVVHTTPLAESGAPISIHDIRALFVVDATGRNARIARALGARRVSFERLAAAFAVLPASPVAQERTGTETRDRPALGSLVVADTGGAEIDHDGLPLSPSTPDDPSANDGRDESRPYNGKELAPRVGARFIAPALSPQSTTKPSTSSPAPEALRNFSPAIHPRASPRPDSSTPFRDPATLVEATPDGWWYSGLLPSGGLVVAFFSDPPIFAAVRAWHRDGWLALLEATIETRERAASFAPLDAAPAIAAAGMARLDRAAGDGWLAVGDAAACHDPLTSHGIGHALHHGPLAAATVLAHLHGDAAALPDWSARVAADHERCRALLRAVYGMETRWPDAPFWRSRSTATR